VQQATVLFNPNANGGRGETRAMRSKEDAHDYRYFPDPDLPPLVIAPEWIEQVRASMPELPRAMAERFQRDHGLPAYDALAVTQSKAHAAYFETATALCAAPKLVANWMMGELARRLNAQSLEIDSAPVAAPVLAQLIARIADATVSNSGARQVFDALWVAGERDSTGIDSASVDRTIDDLGLKQISDTGELERLLDDVLARNPKSVDEVRAGKDKAFNALVGQAMKATQGKANPALITELLRKKLG
jgi:aspartyl-tRNA(Asn)/glutamyl-tRNA(Gln) amidotransferase subunit B